LSILSFSYICFVDSTKTQLMNKIYAFFAACFFAVVALSAQNVATPNAGFENWTHTSGTVAYDDATSWSDLNSTTGGFGVITCYKASAAGDFHNGTYAMKLVTKSVLGQNANGIATTGTINTSTQAISGGIAYTGRPDSIVGYYKSTPVGSDHGFIQLLLSGTSDTDTIGYVRFKTPATAVATYTRFAAKMWYKSTNPVTKSQWLLSSSAGNTGQQVNATLFVDDLDLVFPSTGIAEQELHSGFHIGPVPAQQELTVYNTRLTKAHITLYLVTGQVVANYPVNNASNVIDLSTFSSGSYLFKITDESGTALNNGKILVQK
jgi:hypothetical protein